MIPVNRVVEVAKSFGINGEPGGNRTHNPQIKSPFRQAKTGQILMILRARCANRTLPRQNDVTQASPEMRSGGQGRGAHIGPAEVLLYIRKQVGAAEIQLLTLP
jgi:hypothetical protein